MLPKTATMFYSETTNRLISLARHRAHQLAIKYDRGHSRIDSWERASLLALIDEAARRGETIATIVDRHAD